VADPRNQRSREEEGSGVDRYVGPVGDPVSRMKRRCDGTFLLVTKPNLRSIQLRSIVFDCPDPSRLAVFYGNLLGGDVDSTDPSWCEVHFAELPLKLAFQRVVAFVPPQWPNGQPQQVHLDITVTDLESASARAIELGARVLAEPVEEENSMFQVHADPAGHPFCFCQEQ
jgi:predicted enzyme related to lactoylglutathione lyase